MQSSSSGQFGGYLRNKWLSPRRVRFWLLLLLILYTLIGFFLVPRVVERIAKNTVEEDFGRELHIESVRTNPFTLTLRIDELVLHDTDDHELISFDRLSVDFAWSSIVRRAWTFNDIELTNPVVHEERFSDGETRFTRLIDEAIDPEDPDPEEEPEPPALRINNLRIAGGVIRFTDNFDTDTDDENDENNAPEQVTIALRDVNLSVENFVLDDDTNSNVQLEAELEDGGTVAFDGAVQMLPSLVLEGDIDIDEVALAQVGPYLHHFLGVQLDSGALSIRGQINTGAEQPLAFRGAASIDELSISQAPDDETLIGWQSLNAEEIDLNIAERALETGTITVDQLAGQIVIYEDQTTNFGELGEEPPAEDDANDDNGTETVVDTGEHDNGTPTDEDGEEVDPFSIIIAGIELNDGGLDFTDDSLPLPFSTSIHSLSGEVSTISSTSAEPARLELEGQVEDYGLARVEGSLHAFQPTRETSITVTFRNIEIPEYSPYTADFAGRTIAGGTMDLDLVYTITEEQLEGDNNLVIRDIELGEAVDDDAMDLRLRLAIALLEDSDGVIDLTLPVSGDVDDPEFDFNALIWEAVGRAFTTVVEAPFRFLAELVGAESEDLGQIEFPEGRSDLGPPQQQRVAELRDALSQRSSLIIELAGPYNRDFDGPALKREKALEGLSQRLEEAGRDTEDPSLTDEEHRDIVEAMFTSHYPDSDLDAVRERYTEDGEFDELAYRNYVADLVVAAQPVADTELEAIGNARATAIREALINADEDTAIAENRVRIIEPEEVDLDDAERIILEVGVTTE